MYRNNLLTRLIDHPVFYIRFDRFLVLSSVGTVWFFWEPTVGSVGAAAGSVTPSVRVNKLFAFYWFLAVEQTKSR